MAAKKKDVSKSADCFSKIRNNGSNTSYVGFAAIVVFAVVIAIPIVVTVLYNIHLFEYDAIPSGDLLNYFGVCLGLMGSTILFFEGRKRERLKDEEERRNRRLDHRPRLSVLVEEAAAPYMKVTITNVGSQIISNIFLADRYIASFLPPLKEVIKLISYEECDEGVAIDLTKVGVDMFDGGKWPKELRFDVCDQDNDVWEVVATRCVDGGKYIYLCEVNLDKNK